MLVFWCWLLYCCRFNIVFIEFDFNPLSHSLTLSLSLNFISKSFWMSLYELHVVNKKNQVHRDNIYVDSWYRMSEWIKDRYSMIIYDSFFFNMYICDVLWMSVWICVYTEGDSIEIQKKNGQKKIIDRKNIFKLYRENEVWIDILCECRRKKNVDEKNEWFWYMTSDKAFFSLSTPKSL